MMLYCIQIERDLNINFMSVSSICLQDSFYNKKILKVFLNKSQAFHFGHYKNNSMNLKITSQ